MGLGHKTFTVSPMRALRFGLDCIYSKYSMCLLYRTQSGLEETEGQLHNGLLSVATRPDSTFNGAKATNSQPQYLYSMMYEPLFPFDNFLCPSLCFLPRSGLDFALLPTGSSYSVAATEGLAPLARLSATVQFISTIVPIIRTILLSGLHCCHGEI